MRLMKLIGRWDNGDKKDKIIYINPVYISFIETQEDMLMCIVHIIGSVRKFYAEDGMDGVQEEFESCTMTDNVEKVKER